MELKTLKDLDIFYIDFEPLKIKINEPLVKCNELKAEAIKWVEFLETPPVSFEDEKTIEWIKCFFNIELKGGKLQ